ncbi:nucleoporin protein Ndc1-Nup [Phyllosticta citrichinensis]|uniref:Nucleoporin protein Ndc1-Nup n=1 Tax=Phyllosticta citrichinensis TaxID=1130410 RepID=A0ABR1Y5B6_9PEZI
MATTKPARPYKDFLSPFLHRQFGRVMLITLVLCYIESMCVGEWGGFLFGFWFISAIRALLLFISYLFVLCLAMSHAHTGRRMTTCSAQTVWEYLPRLSTVYTIICYGASAFFYSAVYIWSRSAKDNFGIVDEGKAWDRSKLNERPLYFYSMLLELAVVQSFVHIYRDYGRIKLPANATGQEKSKRTVLKRRLLPILNDVLTRMILFTVVGNGIYFLFIRMRAWRLAYPFAKFQDPSVKDMKPRAANFIGLSMRVFVQGFLLTLLWEFANVALAIYLAKQPLKRQKDQTMKPITNDSKDPNGSLLNGLTLKKDLLRNMAFWELAIIANRFPERRQTIYTELESHRPGGATVKQVIAACLAEITEIKTRIASTATPTPPPAAENKALVPVEKPRSAIAPSPLSEDDIFAPSPPPKTRQERNLQRINDFARRRGTGGINEEHPFKSTVGHGQQLLAQHVQPATLLSQAQAKFVSVLSSPLGMPFRQTFNRRVAAVLLGAPYSHTTTIGNAVNAVTQIALRSIQEDTYAMVNRDVATIIRTFADVIRAIEDFVRSFPPHWTDVAFNETRDRDVRTVDGVREVLVALKGGLEAILTEFGVYLSGLDMSEKETREARELVHGWREKLLWEDERS